MESVSAERNKCFDNAAPSSLLIDDIAITTNDQKVTEVDADAADDDVTSRKSYFNLSSKEGQEHLKELNEELKALNTDGSTSLSLLHGPSSSFDESRLKKKVRKRKRQLEIVRCTGEDDGDDGAGPSTSKCGSSRTVSRKMFRSKDKDKSDDEEEIPIGAAEREIDTILNEKAWRSNLTTINVKNILRYVITNEHVLSMVRNSMNEESGKRCGDVGAVYEQKLTRSKAKELMEKREKVPWPISPLKFPSPSKTKPLIELEFSESSSDEEYRPGNESESDADESFLSQTSEVESPKISPVVTQSVVVKSPLKSDEQMQTDEQNEDTIALRTRSKLPLNDTPLEFLESNFIAPDITTDMYDSECDDEDWGNFLGAFLKPLDPDPSAVVDDDANDPEYNFLEEEDIPDREDLRNDKAVKISKKEIQELLAELFEAAEDEMNEGDDEDQGGEKPSTAVTNETSKKEKSSKSLGRSNEDQTEYNEPLFDYGRKQQLDEQMRQHVQLLTQVLLLTAKIEAFSQENKMCQTLMLELNSLAANGQALYGGVSAFSSHNLPGAIQIVASYNDRSNDRTSGPEKTGPTFNRRRRKLPSDIVDLIANSQVFIYSELLPTAGFCHPFKSKDTFIKSEDVLLALGLEQFQPLATRKNFFSVWKLIKDNMLPIKTTKQIFIRVKNLRRNSSPPNPVKYFYEFEKTQPMTQSVNHFDAESVKPPAQQPIDDLPEWLQKYIERDKRSLAPVLLQAVTNVQEKKWKNVPIAPQTFSISPLAFTSTPQASSLEMAVVVSSALPSRPISSPAVCDQSILVSYCSTPEKAASTFSMSMPIIVGSHMATVSRVSPLKRVSPILKKYRPKCLRKTGGNLKKVIPRLHPKIVFINPGPRKLAPKVPPIPEESKSGTPDTVEAKPISSVVKDKEDDCEEIYDENFRDGKDSADVPKEVLSDLDSDVEIFDDGDDTADDEGIDMQADNEDDLAALMTASTTMKTMPKHREQMICKKRKQIQEREQLLASLNLENDPLREERETAFAQAYLQKAKEAVGDDQLFEDFLRILNDFNQTEGNAVQLFKDICLLLKDFPEICEEFVAFLPADQAMECGKYLEHLSFSKIQLFLRKLEVQFGKHSQQLQRIVKLFRHFQQQENVSLSEITDAMLPMFRGQTHLVEDFLQLFPQASPPESSMVDFEEVFIPDGDEEIDVDEDRYEVVELPEIDDVYGTKDCICDCHVKSDKPKLMNRQKHCLRCGIKFIDGRIFLQTGKVLKPCRVVYHDRENGQRAETGDKQNLRSEGEDAAVASPSSSSSSLSPPTFKDSDDEFGVIQPETSIDVMKQKDEKLEMEKPANPFLEALEQISQKNGTPFIVNSASTTLVTEDAILTADMSAVTGAEVPADFSLIRNVIHNEVPMLNLDVLHERVDCNTWKETNV